jgi:hypothetical protein
VLFVVVAVMATILPMILRGQLARALVVGVGAALAGIVVLVAGPAAAPAQSTYLQGRFATVSSPAQALNEPNVSSRIERFKDAQRAGVHTDRVFGASFYEISPTSESLRHRSYDGDWIRVAYYTGPAGLVALATPLILGVSWGVWGYARRKNAAGTGTLLLAGVLATVYAAGWSSVGLVYFWWPALSLFPLALIAYAMGFPAVAADASSAVGFAPGSDGAESRPETH